MFIHSFACKTLVNNDIEYCYVNSAYLIAYITVVCYTGINMKIRLLLRCIHHFKSD